MCIPGTVELIKETMDEAHQYNYSIHIKGSTKMHKDLPNYWW